MMNPLKRFRSWAIGHIEKRSNVAGYSAGMYAALRGMGFGVNVAGVKVNRETAMKLTALLRGIQLISNYVGKTPCDVKHNLVVDSSHPAHQRIGPNKWSWLYRTSAFEFRRTLTKHALTAGNGYGWIKRDKNMRPIEVRILHPDCCVPFIENGQLGYLVSVGMNTDGSLMTVGDAAHSNPMSNTRKLKPWDVIHIRGLGDGLVGYDLITYGSEALGGALAQQRFANKYYENAGSPSLVIEFENPLDDDDFNRLGAQWNQIGSGLDAAHEPLILDNGGKVKSYNVDAEKTQLLAARQFNLVEIANLLNISAQKLNALVNSSYKSLEEENASFRNDTLDPWFCQFETEFTKLLTEAERESGEWEIEFSREQLLRSNLKDRGDYLAKAVGGAWMTPNDARVITNQAPVTDGDKLNKAPVKLAKEARDDETRSFRSEMRSMLEAIPAIFERALRSSEPVPAGLPSVEKQVAAVADVAGRMCRRLSTQATRAAKNSKAFPDFLDSIGEQETTLRMAFQPVLDLCGRDDSAGELSEAIVAELRTLLQTAYDNETPDNFETVVGTVVERFSEPATAERFAKQILAA